MLIGYIIIPFQTAPTGEVLTVRGPPSQGFSNHAPGHKGQVASGEPNRKRRHQHQCPAPWSIAPGRISPGFRPRLQVEKMVGSFWMMINLTYLKNGGS